MNIQAIASVNLRHWLAGMAVIVVIFIAFGSLAISARDSDGMFSPAVPAESAAPSAAVPGARNFRCAECGVIESTREIDVIDGHSVDGHSGVKAPGRNAPGQRGEMRGDGPMNPIRNSEITIRLQDGSTRVITDSQSAKWKNGARIKVIAGMNQ